jgi:hypothetical protein
MYVIIQVKHTLQLLVPLLVLGRCVLLWWQRLHANVLSRPHHPPCWRSLCQGLQLPPRKQP